MPRRRAEPVELQKYHGRTDAASDVRQQQALQLRIAGATYREIGDQLYDGNKGNAYTSIHRLLDRVDADRAKEYRELEAARLDRLWLAHWPKAIAGDQKASQLCLRISERRARLLGLDAPIKLEGRVRDSIDAQIEELAAQIGLQPAPVDTPADDLL